MISNIIFATIFQASNVTIITSDIRELQLFKRFLKVKRKEVCSFDISTDIKVAFSCTDKEKSALIHSFYDEFGVNLLKKRSDGTLYNEFPRYKFSAYGNMKVRQSASIPGQGLLDTIMSDAEVRRSIGNSSKVIEVRYLLRPWLNEGLELVSACWGQISIQQGKTVKRIEFKLPREHGGYM